MAAPEKKIESMPVEMTLRSNTKNCREKLSAQVYYERWGRRGEQDSTTLRAKTQRELE